MSGSWPVVRVPNRVPGLRLVLHHHGARRHLIAVTDVPNLEADEVTAEKCLPPGHCPKPFPDNGTTRKGHVHE
jgi:hypothetical protein